MRRTACLVVALLALGPVRAGPSAAPLTPLPTGPPITNVGPPPVGPRPVRYAAPVTPVDVVRAFDPPATPYGAGHRGVDLATSPGEQVRAAADGVVSFAGTVAGRGVVVLRHRDGISTEYEPVAAAVSAGTVVRRGDVLGPVHGRHGRCRRDRCLHWGARRDGDYLDPMSLLARLGPVRLLPWADGG
jgi:murein DD-endopeptidase MepM/ murein hydrolase activator NlpD